MVTTTGYVDSMDRGWVKYVEWLKDGHMGEVLGWKEDLEVLGLRT
jgi:hypothetical protein